MNYQFPIIKTIDDVLPSIKGRKDFVVMDKGDYTIIDYVYTEPDSFDDIMRRECRGITFDKTGKLISRPFQKFFNLGEREETQPHNINLSNQHQVLVKADGSMIRPVMVNGQILPMTRKGYTDVAKQAWDEIEFEDTEWEPLIYDWLYNGHTPIFEFVSPKNKIVIEYKKPELILLAVRDNWTGEYLPVFGRQITTSVSFSNPHSIRDEVKDLTGIEGYVIRFDDGHMIKIKTDDYLRLHRTIDIFDSEKNILQIILNNQLDDLYPLLEPTKVDRLERFVEAVNNVILKHCQIIRSGVDIFNNKTQKEFAIWVNKKNSPFGLMKILILNSGHYGFNSERGWIFQITKL